MSVVNQLSSVQIEKGEPRVPAVDDFRLLMAYAVIAVHTLPNSAPTNGTDPWTMIIGYLCRAAVPFFFVVSGRLLSYSGDIKRDLTKPIKRLMPIYIFWFSIYFIVFHIFPQPDQWPYSLHDLLTGGIGFQLWFLPALIFSQVLVASLQRRLSTGVVTVVCLAIAAVGLWDVYGLRPRLPSRYWLPGLCAGPILVLAGHHLVRTWKVAKLTAAIAFFAAFLASLGEDFLISRTTGSPLYFNSISISTCLMGIALAMLAFASSVSRVRKFNIHSGRLSLPIYCIHIIFIFPLTSRIHSIDLETSFIIFLFTSIFSTVASFLLLRVPWLRRFVN